MPINPNTPEPLAEALRSMEATVNSRVQSLLFAAPEQVDFHKGVFKDELSDILTELWEAKK